MLGWCEAVSAAALGVYGHLVRCAAFLVEEAAAREVLPQLSPLWLWQHGRGCLQCARTLQVWHMASYRAQHHTCSASGACCCSSMRKCLRLSGRVATLWLVAS